MLLKCTLIFHQQPDEAARDRLHDYAWAAMQLLIDEGCVELIQPPTPAVAKPTATATKATASASLVAATTSTSGGAGGGGKGGGSKRVADAATHATHAPAAYVPAKRSKPIVVGQQLGAQSPPFAVHNNTAAAARARRATAAMSCGAQDGDFRKEPRSGDLGSASGVEEAVIDDRLLVPTKLGLAIFRSSMPPGDGLMIYRDLSGRGGGGFRRCFAFARALNSMPNVRLSCSILILCRLHCTSQRSRGSVNTCPTFGVISTMLLCFPLVYHMLSVPSRLTHPVYIPSSNRNKRRLAIFSTKTLDRSSFPRGEERNQPPPYPLLGLPAHPTEPPGGTQAKLGKVAGGETACSTDRSKRRLLSSFFCRGIDKLGAAVLAACCGYLFVHVSPASSK